MIFNDIHVVEYQHVIYFSLFLFGRLKISSYLTTVSFPLIQKGYSHTYLIILYVYVFFKQNNGWFPKQPKFYE